MGLQNSIHRHNIRKKFNEVITELKLTPSDLMVACCHLLKLATKDMTAKMLVPVNALESVIERDHNNCEFVLMVDDMLKELFWYLKSDEQDTSPD